MQDDWRPLAGGPDSKNGPELEKACVFDARAIRTGYVGVPFFPAGVPGGRFCLIGGGKLFLDYALAGQRAWRRSCPPPTVDQFIRWHVVTRLAERLKDDRTHGCASLRRPDSERS